MQINNWFDFIAYTLFTLGVVFIGIPVAIFSLKKGIEGFIKFGCGKLPNSFINHKDWGKRPSELFFVGLFMGFGSFWYLFIDNDGNLFFWFKQIKIFFNL